MGKKQLEIEFIRSEFEKEDYVLLTKDYKNCSQRLEYICPKGHEHVISWDNWKAGHRCTYCAGQGKPGIKIIKKFFEAEGYELLSNNYVNDGGKLLYKCPVGHIYSMRWGNFRYGKRCPECDRVRNSLSKSGSNHYNWKGGISCEPYCDAWADKEYKESIKERDNYQCQNPDCWGTSKRLTIHHIDYDKKNCNPSNLITVCNSCNSRANNDREWHKLFYSIIMEKKRSSINNMAALHNE